MYVSQYRVRTGHGKPGKLWNLSIPVSRPGKLWNCILLVMENWLWKVMEFEKLKRVQKKPCQ